MKKSYPEKQLSHTTSSAVFLPTAELDVQKIGSGVRRVTSKLMQGVLKVVQNEGMKWPLKLQTYLCKCHKNV